MAFNPRQFLLNQSVVVYGRHCLVCKEDFEKPDDYYCHTRTLEHQQRVRQLRTEQQLIRSVLNKQQRVQSFFEPRISILSCPDWKKTLRADLYMFLNEEGPASTRETAAVQTLEHFEHLERVALLEQAVWRSVCQLNPAYTTSDPMYNFQWFQQGWKDRKEEMRHSSSIGIVVKSVLPFLGQDSK